LSAASLSESKRKLRNKNKKWTNIMLAMIAFKVNAYKENLSQDGVTIGLHSTNARHRSDQNFWSPHLQFKILTIRICKNHDFAFNVYGREIWSIKLQRRQRVWVFQNRLLIKIFKGKEIK